jgi:hypothetical protein
MLMFLFVTLCCTASIALGQEPEFVEQVVSIPKAISTWPGFAEFIAWMIGLQVMLRGVAEGLTRISNYTDTKWDNKIAGWLSEAAWLLGTGLGKLGYGVPKLVVEEKAKQAAEVKPQ